VSFQLPGDPTKPKARPLTAVASKSRRTKRASEDDKPIAASAKGASVSADPHYQVRPQSAPVRQRDVSKYHQERGEFDNYLESLLVVNFEVSSRKSNERPSSSPKTSSRAFERAFRGRVWTAHDNPENHKNISESFADIIGTGTAIRPKTTDLIMGQAEPLIIKNELVKNSDEVSDLSSSLPDVRPFTSLNMGSPCQRRSQTVRNNVDKFQIEQITLRRLRYVIENHSEAPDHLHMVDMLESSHVPAEIIQSFFGSNIQSLHDIRILILQGIDNTRRSNEKRKKLEDQIKKHKMIGMNLAKDKLDNVDENEMKTLESTARDTIGRTPVHILPVREKPTTPSEILTILKSIETKKSIRSRKFAPLKGGGSASYARKSAVEANQLQIKMKNTTADDKKKNKWKPVSYRKTIVPANNTKSTRASEEGLNLKQEHREALNTVTVLSPKNIIRMVEGRRLSIFQ
jgi:hypothetical protein